MMSSACICQTATVGINRQYSTDANFDTGAHMPFITVLDVYKAASVKQAQHDSTIVQVHLVERIPWHEALYFVTTTLTTGTQN